MVSCFKLFLLPIAVQCSKSLRHVTVMMQVSISYSKRIIKSVVQEYETELDVPCNCIQGPLVRSSATLIFRMIL